MRLTQRGRRLRVFAVLALATVTILHFPHKSHRQAAVLRARPVDLSSQAPEETRAVCQHVRDVARQQAIVQRAREVAAAQAALAAQRAREAASRAAQRPPLSVPATASAEQWAHGAFAVRVASCESGGDPTEVDDNGGTYYFGKWQMNQDFVETYGGGDPWRWVRGGKFTMPESEQDEVAYRGYQARGWEPWACASMV